MRIVIIVVISVCFISCNTIWLLKYPKQKKYENIYIEMKEEDFKIQHKIAKVCYIENKRIVYYITYKNDKRNSEEIEFFNKYYYFEEGKLTHSDYGKKAKETGFKLPEH